MKLSYISIALSTAAVANAAASIGEGCEDHIMLQFRGQETVTEICYQQEVTTPSPVFFRGETRLVGTYGFHYEYEGDFAGPGFYVSWRNADDTTCTASTSDGECRSCTRCDDDFITVDCRNLRNGRATVCEELRPGSLFFPYNVAGLQNADPDGLVEESEGEPCTARFGCARDNDNDNDGEDSPIVVEKSEPCSSRFGCPRNNDNEGGRREPSGQETETDKPCTSRFGR